MNVGNAVEFGIWKIYNNGDNLFFVDPDGKRVLRIDGTVGSGSTLHVVFSREDNNDDIKGFYLFDGGTASKTSTSNRTYNDYLETVNGTQSLGQLRNGNYQFARMRFQIDGNTMIMYERNDVASSASGRVLPELSVIKNNNSVLWAGTDTFSKFDPTLFVQNTGQISILPAHTGSWYDPASEGRGGFINIAEQGSQTIFVLAWFDYNEDGSQNWVVGSAPIEPGVSNVTVPVQITRKDNDGAVLKTDNGVFEFAFLSSDNAELVIRTGDVFQSIQRHICWDWGNDATLRCAIFTIIGLGITAPLYHLYH